MWHFVLLVRYFNHQKVFNKPKSSFQKQKQTSTLTYSLWVQGKAMLFKIINSNCNSTLKKKPGYLCFPLRKVCACTPHLAVGQVKK